MKTLLVGLFTVILLVACSPVATNPLRDTGFLRPSSYSVDSDLLNQMTEELGTLDFHAVLVIKDGALVYENYFSRKDEEWGQGIGLVNFDESTLHDLRSATKSIISALIGIAIEDGSIPSLSTPVTELLNKETLSAYHPPPGYPPLLLSHLLSMSSGFEWNERMSYADPKNSEIQMWESDEPAKFALSSAIAVEPGSLFNYNGGLTQILVEILEENTGVPADEYALEKLFKPLGISDFAWVRHHSGQVWGASGLRLNARDFAKIGQLYLQHGLWLGEQVLPPGWVSSTFQPRIDPGFPVKIEYGLHWWVPDYQYDGKPLKTAMAQGNGGQTLLLFPEHDLMMVTLAGYYNDVAKMIMLPPKIAREYVLPAVGLSDVYQMRSKRPVSKKANAP